MAAILLSSGTKGKRMCLPNGEVMIHQPLGGVQGQATDIEITAKHIIKIKEKLVNILSENTGKDKEQVAKDIDRDYYMSAEQALNYGIVDKIINKRK